MINNNIEVMAPVGSYESLAAAISAGAGSIYFGIGELNMRSQSAANFTLSDMHEICKISRDNNVRTYLTLNTVVFDDEVERIAAIIEAAKEAEVTAIIAADIAVIQLCREIGVPIHISTQANITNFEAVKFYAQFADVVVLAREMTLDKVKRISDLITLHDLRGPKGELIRIEMFVHGALCMAVSGKCYLSLHEKNRSANRGSCIQICRRTYDVKDNEAGTELEIDNKYIMSPKDLKTIHFLNKLLDAGVSLLKIEGRAKSPEYVKSVVSCYKEAAQLYVDGEFNDENENLTEIIGAWDNRLSRVFNREFWDGYYLGQRLGEWSAGYGSAAKTKKSYIGKCTNFFAKIGVAEFILESDSISQGDEYIITGKTTGVVEGVAEEIRVDFKKVEIAQKGDQLSIKPEEAVRRGDSLYKIINKSLK